MNYHFEQYQYHIRMGNRYPSTYTHHKGLANYHYAMWNSLTTGQSPLPIHDGTGVIILERKIEKPLVNVLYPYIGGCTDVGLQYRINRRVMDKVHQMLRDQFRDAPAPKVSITGGYAIKLNQKHVLSLYLTHYSYVEGADYGVTTAESLTFMNGSDINWPLSQLFIKDASYAQPINEQIQAQIKARSMPFIHDFKGIRPLQNYYLTKNNLTVYFQSCEYTAYDYGIPEFYIPYRTLEDILDPVGPIGILSN